MTYITIKNSNGIRLPKQLIEELRYEYPDLMSYQWRLSYENVPFISMNSTDYPGYEKPRKHITGYYIKSKFFNQIYPDNNCKKVILERVPGYPYEYYVKPYYLKES